MAFVTAVNRFSEKKLKAIMQGVTDFSISDMDFLDTLAAHKCLVVTPWVMRASPAGGLARVARLQYRPDGNIDKPRVLLEVAKEFRRAQKRTRPNLHNRFASEFGKDAPTPHEPT